VDFVAKKAGGLLRVPSEIEVDSIVALGQFLARYSAREFAKWEDTVLFNADGSATYKLISGVCKKADTLGKKVQLAAGKTSPVDAQLSDFRSVRALVDSAALATSAYYMSLTHESRLTGFNTNENGQVFTWTNGMARLDGFPVRWVDVLPAYDTGAHPGQYQFAFGDLSYWFLGERGTPALDVSRDVFFATDEIAMRALERIDVGLLADGAMAVLKLADA
jgi:HK97 family phage major capsid protein